ncbi:hypothetical protein ACFL0Q_08660, partial [Thermodesulfobacteriota bacterium]
GEDSMTLRLWPSTIRNFAIGFAVPVAVLGMLLTLGTASSSAWNRCLRSTEDLTGIDERFSGINPSERDWIESFSGTWSRFGLMLTAGSQGFARLRFPRSAGEELRLRLWAYDYGACEVVWWSSGRQDQQARALSREGVLIGKSFRVPQVARDDTVTVEVRGENTTGAQQILLDRITVARVPCEPLNGWAVVLWAWGALSVTWWWLAVKTGWWRPPHGVWLWTAALVVVVIGATLRLELLSFMIGVPLDQDVSMYRSHARNLHWFTMDRGFYSASFGEREPLWVAVVQGFQAWTGEGDLSVRLLTVLLSTGVIALTGAFLCRWLSGSVWTVTGMSMVALNPALIEESCRGLRSEAMTLGFLFFLMASLPSRDSRFRPLGAGMLTGVWALLRSPALGIAAGLWGFICLSGLLVRRWRLPLQVPEGYSLAKICLAIFAGLIIFVPHLYGFERTRGDWRWPSRWYARWNANMEFPEKLGTPGFPTLEEFNESPYAGPPMTYGHYMFGLHTPVQILQYQALGWIELTGAQCLSLSSRSLCLANHMARRTFTGLRRIVAPSFILAVLAGTIAAVSWVRVFASASLWWAPFALLWGTYYVAFVYHVRLVEVYRHGIHVYPLLVLITMWGARRLWKETPFAGTSARTPADERG